MKSSGDILFHREILDLKKKLQDNKQMLVILRERCGGDDNIESFRPTDVSLDQEISDPLPNKFHYLQYSKKSGSNGPTRWTDDEIEAALEGKSEEITVIKDTLKENVPLYMIMHSI